MKKLLFPLLALLLSTNLFAQDDELLEPEQAFALTVTAVNVDTIEARWDIADGYYLYRSKFKFSSDTPYITLGEPQIPAGKIKHDEFFGDVEIYRGSVTITIPVERAADAPASLKLTATSQGCADVGVCYPPQHQQREVSLPEQVPAPPITGLSALSNEFSPLGGGEEEVLEPNQAFHFDAIVENGNTLLARWEIAPKHYLYKDKFRFTLTNSEGVTLGQPQLPQGEEKDDEFFGRIQVYHNTVEARLPLQRTNLAPTEVTLKVSYQGCAEAGICYPPQKKDISLQLPVGSTSPPSRADANTGSPTTSPTLAEGAPVSEQDRLAAALASGNRGWTILTFFGLGLLLTFTPCVFPMIPILSSIITGQGASLTTYRAFAISLAYVLAMALTYTVVGVFAGLGGANLQIWFQNPWVLSAFAMIFVALSFSMFGFYDLQLPSALQSKLTEVSNRQHGGTLVGAAIMGLLSALIVGPCVTAPLIGALLYISHTGDAVLGGLTLFALGMGMGAPLLLIGTAGGKILPRAGSWMDAVKAVFGVMLLAVAIWMLERILPATITMLLQALLLIISAVYMGAIDAVREGVSGWYKLWKGLGLVLLIQGVLMLIGLAAGATDPLQPLKGVSFGNAAVEQQHLTFKTVKTIDDLEREVAAASAAGKSVMLDFYADWCISCKEFEKYTFSDPQVLAALSNTIALQADVTANDESDQSMLKRFDLIGPPGIIFYDDQGNELASHRVVGFMPADEFASHIKNALP